jgi:hypothetical protein
MIGLACMAKALVDMWPSTSPSHTRPSSVSSAKTPRAILTEPACHQALLNDHGPWARSVRRRRVMHPLLRPLAAVAPRLGVPVSSYLSWKDLIDTRRTAETSSGGW